MRRVRPSVDDPRISCLRVSLSDLPAAIQPRLHEASSFLLRDLTLGEAVGAVRPLPHLFEHDFEWRAGLWRELSLTPWFFYPRILVTRHQSLGAIFRRLRLNDFFEARIAAERIPQGQQL